ncbi:MAG: endoxylanase [Verrucomicrobiales bacterium]|nr:endoxylanase [Verrucomicrobiales bacterium]|tara:strand:+ start:3631 stop:4230 length:600 start_codon:yes stop_codon:yes gene_type:complete
MKTYQVKHSGTLDCSEGEALTDFSLPWVDRECPSTSFRAVWNDEWLGFQFQAVDDDIVLCEGKDRDDSVLGSDRVELFFATDHELKDYYYGIEMDPRGWVFDFRARHYREIDDHWDFPSLKISARRGDGGYFVEGRLSLQVLADHNLVRREKLIIGVYRAEFSMMGNGVQEDWISWVDPQTERPDFHVPSSFGEFLLVK